jgi:tryptophan 2,3-dioxygenase
VPTFKPQTPTIVDPAGVKTGNAVRPMGQTTDTSRAEMVDETGGLPRVDFENTSNPYIEYQNLDLLLTLQHPRSDAYDEMCFYIMGQVKELLFKSLHFELHNARHLICQGQLDDALFIADRALEITKLLTNAWDVVATVSAEGFNQFRNHLDEASGQLSFMFRHVEFVLGNKDRRLASAHRNVPHVWPYMKEALESPSLYDEVLQLLNRQGFEIAPEALERDWADQYAPHESVEQAWFDIISSPSTSSGLYKLGEVLVALDDQMAQYRWRHFVLVSRIIGYKPGTGGSAGVEWLRHTTDFRYFPELWSVRTRLET